MADPDDLSHIEITPELFYKGIAEQENQAIEAANSPIFRAMMGDETADGVIELARESLAKIPEEYRMKEETT